MNSLPRSYPDFHPGLLLDPHPVPGPRGPGSRPHRSAPVPLPAPAHHPTFRAIRELRSPR
ncbi:hypothetical protein GCM10023323_42680 [Streptomyces thinghirensis]|uniref:Uncharacterized protein n=1 Tax=Streptomyces thinghirensis TaxID=551547 RepID=A0ABP9T9A4_9ACTN